MTEKHYGGSTGFGFKGKDTSGTKHGVVVESKREKKEESESEGINNEGIANIEKAGRITREVRKFAKEIAKPKTLLLEIAEKIEVKIVELGGKPAFPVNLSINEIAAHYTPSWDDKTLAHGLLKVDFGVHIEGYAVDNSLSIDCDNDAGNKKLIEAAEEALKSGLDVFGKGIALREVGKVIDEEISVRGFNSIKNLSGHSIERYNLHAGLNVPNYDNGQEIKLEEGLYAVEPFATNGNGKVRDGRVSGIYSLVKEGNVRDNFARGVLFFIAEEYGSLPFCSRWIHKKFGGRGLLALRMIEQAGLLHQYPQLIEIANGKVAQAEHSVLLFNGKKMVVTRD